MAAKREKQVMHCSVAYHPLINARPPFLNPDHLPFQLTPPIYLLGMTFYAVEYPFGLFRLSIPAMLPPGFICLSSHWHSMKLGGKSLA